MRAQRTSAGRRSSRQSVTQTGVARPQNEIYREIRRRRAPIAAPWSEASFRNLDRAKNLIQGFIRGHTFEFCFWVQRYSMTERAFCGGLHVVRNKEIPAFHGRERLGYAQ